MGDSFGNIAVMNKFGLRSSPRNINRDGISEDPSKTKKTCELSKRATKKIGQRKSNARNGSLTPPADTESSSSFCAESSQSSTSCPQECQKGLEANNVLLGDQGEHPFDLKIEINSESDSSEQSYVVLDEIDSRSESEGGTPKTLSPKKKRQKIKLSKRVETSPETPSPQKSCEPVNQGASDSEKRDQECASKEKCSKIGDEIKDMDDVVGLILEEMESDDDIEEICDVKPKLPKAEDSSDSEALFSAITEMAKEEDELSDNEDIQSAISEICKEEEEQQMLSKQVESIIDDICKEEDSNKLEDDSDKLSSDDGSFKDGIDIDSVLKAICDDEDEMCDRVDSLLKKKAVDETADSSATKEGSDVPESVIESHMNFTAAEKSTETKSEGGESCEVVERTVDCDDSKSYSKKKIVPKEKCTESSENLASSTEKLMQEEDIQVQEQSSRKQEEDMEVEEQSSTSGLISVETEATDNVVETNVESIASHKMDEGKSASQQIDEETISLKVTNAKTVVVSSVADAISSVPKTACTDDLVSEISGTANAPEEKSTENVVPELMNTANNVSEVMDASSGVSLATTTNIVSEARDTINIGPKVTDTANYPLEVTDVDTVAPELAITKNIVSTATSIFQEIGKTASEVTDTANKDSELNGITNMVSEIMNMSSVVSETKKSDSAVTKGGSMKDTVLEGSSMTAVSQKCPIKTDALDSTNSGDLAVAVDIERTALETDVHSDKNRNDKSLSRDNVEKSGSEGELIKTSIEDSFIEGATSVLNAILNIVTLQVEQTFASDRIAAMQSAIDEAVSESLPSSIEADENTFVISNVISTDPEECPVLDTCGSSATKRQLKDDGAECTVQKRPKMDCIASETFMDESISKIPSEDSLPSTLVISDVVDGNMLQSSIGNKSKPEEEDMDVCSMHSSDSSIDTGKSSKEINDLLISNVQTCAEEESKSIDSLEGTDKLCSMLPLNQDNSSDSDKSLCKRLLIADNLQDIIKSLSSSNSDEKSNSSVNKEVVVSSMPKNADENENQVPLTAIEKLNKSKMDISEYEVTETKDSFPPDTLESTFKENQSNVSDEETTTASSESSASSTFLPYMNGICPEMILDKIPNVIDSSNEDLFVDIHENDLCRIIRGKIHEHCSKKYRNALRDVKMDLDNLKLDLENLKASASHIRAQMRTIVTSQNNSFRQFGYIPKVEKRTVGVNVRIVQQPDNRLRTYSNLSNFSKNGAPVSQAPCNVPTKMPTNPSPAKSTSQSNSILGTVLQNSKGTVVSPSQSSGPLGNNVTTMKPSPPGTVKASMVATNAVPLSTSVMVLSSNTSVTSTSHQVVDLTNEDSPKRKASTSIAPSVPATVPRTQLSSKTSAQQSLISLPLMTSLPSMVQLIPQGTTATNSGVDGAAVRMVRSATPVNQPARLAYIMSNSSASLPMIQQIGAGPPRLAVNVSPQQPSLIRPPVQAFVLTQMPVVSQGAQPTTVARTSSSSSPSIPPVSTASMIPIPSPSSQLTLTPCFNKHPAPLPQPPTYPPNPKLKLLPPKPSLKMNKVSNENLVGGASWTSGIVLSWNMNLTNKHADIATYQLYAYQENKGPVSHLLWKKVGDIKALPLPMACTLTQFVEGHKYHFTVRAIDVHKRLGPFSEPASILLCIRGKNGDSPLISSPR